jgi:hypothetical protein
MERKIKMEFVVGYIGVWAALGAASLLESNVQKPAKNYQELMKRDSFKQDDRV